MTIAVVRLLFVTTIPFPWLGTRPRQRRYWRKLEGRQKKNAAVTNQGGAKLLLEEMNWHQKESVERIISAGVTQENAGIPASWLEP
jgi:hypothetical protein